MSILFRQKIVSKVIAATVAALAFFTAPTAGAQQIGTCPRSAGEAYLDANNVSTRIVNGNRWLLQRVNMYHDVQWVSAVPTKTAWTYKSRDDELIGA